MSDNWVALSCCNFLTAWMDDSCQSLLLFASDVITWVSWPSASWLLRWTQAGVLSRWLSLADWLDAWYLVGYVTTALGLSSVLLVGSLGLKSGSQAWLAGWCGCSWAVALAGWCNCKWTVACLAWVLCLRPKCLEFPSYFMKSHKNH